MISIIPAIDIIDGKCVRLTKGKFNTKKVYHNHPLQVAKEFELAGIKRLHLVDLDGARKKKIVNWKVLEKIASQTSLQIDFGGGVQSDDDIQLAFDCGAAQVTAGSIAVSNPKKVKDWLVRYGPERIILGSDVKNGKIAIHGWQKQTEKELISFLEVFFEAGILSVICTDISRDGVLKGPAVELYKNIKKQFPELYLIASGGVSKVADISILNQNNINGVIIGKALYEGNIQLEELVPFL